MREGRVAAQHSLPCSAVIDERGHLQKVRLSATPLVAQDAARARSSVIPTRPHFLHFCRKSLALGRVIERALPRARRARVRIELDELDREYVKTSTSDPSR